MNNRTVFKYRLPFVDSFQLKLPEGAQVIHFAEQHWCAGCLAEMEKV